MRKRRLSRVVEVSAAHVTSYTGCSCGASRVGCRTWSSQTPAPSTGRDRRSTTSTCASPTCAASQAFYDAALEPLGIPFLLDLPHLKAFGSLAISDDGEPTRGAHVAFVAWSREAVDAFHAAGIAAGGTDNGAPGDRPHGAYAAYVLDPDGTNVEAAFRVWPR